MFIKLVVIAMDISFCVASMGRLMRRDYPLFCHQSVLYSFSRPLVPGSALVVHCGITLLCVTLTGVQQLPECSNLLSPEVVLLVSARNSTVLASCPGKEYFRENLIVLMSSVCPSIHLSVLCRPSEDVML